MMVSRGCEYLAFGFYSGSTCASGFPTTRSLKYAKISWNIVWVSLGSKSTPSAERVKQLVTFSRLSLANCMVKTIRLLQPSAHVLTASPSDREGVCQNGL